MKPSDNASNQKNANKGSPGTNRQYDQAMGNRGQQMNPNQTGNPGASSSGPKPGASGSKKGR